jgi:hypothetical protein
VKSQNINIRADSLISAFVLTSQPAGNGKIYLGSKETGKFILVKKYWDPIACLLWKPITLRKLAERLSQMDSQNFPKEKALALTKIMILKLAEHGLVHKIDETELYKPRQPEKAFLACPRWARVFVKPYFIPFYFILASLALILPLFSQDLIPRSQDFFWHPRFSISLLTSFVFVWISGFLHEFVHFMTACSQGVWGKIRLSYRLNFLVLETTFPSLHAIARPWRISVFLSGMIVDLMLLACFYLLILTQGSLLLKQLALLTWLGVLWQFLFFTRTDFYFVIKEIVGVENLYTYAKEKIYSVLTGKPFNHSLTKKERFWVNTYAIFFFIGTFLAIVRYGFYHLPIITKLILGSFQNLVLGYQTQNTTMFSDGLVAISIQILVTILLIYEVYKKKRGVWTFFRIF